MSHASIWQIWSHIMLFVRVEVATEVGCSEVVSVCSLLVLPMVDFKVDISVVVNAVVIIRVDVVSVLADVVAIMVTIVVPVVAKLVVDVENMFAVVLFVVPCCHQRWLAARPACWSLGQTLN